jgi:hypothetical protein
MGWVILVEWENVFASTDCGIGSRVGHEAGLLAALMLSNRGADVIHVDPPGGPRRISEWQMLHRHWSRPRPCKPRTCPPAGDEVRRYTTHHFGTVWHTDGDALTRRVPGQKALDGLLRRRLVLGLFPVFDERGVRRQRGELS